MSTTNTKDQLLTYGEGGPIVGVYIICKNEKDFIERCYRTVEEADYIVVCDTGSTDGTYEKLLELAVENPALTVKKIHISPWRFDDAKNVALSLLPNNVDVYVSIDADELMENGWCRSLKTEVTKDHLKNGKISDRYNHRFMTIWNWDRPTEAPNCSRHWHERIHGRGYRWKLPVHEVLVTDKVEAVTWLENLLMIQKPNILTKSRSSYLPLLEQSVKEDPTIWKSWSFLAGEYDAINEYYKAVAAIDSAKRLNNSDKAFLCYQVALIHRKHCNWNLAEAEFLNAVKASPNIREYKVYLAEFYAYSVNRYAEARMWITDAAAITERSKGYEFNPNCWDSGFELTVNNIKRLNDEL